MTKFEMAEKLSVKCNVTLEEARNALEAGDWNMLTATHLLDQEKFRRMREIDEVASGCATMAVPASEEETVAKAQAAADDVIVRLEDVRNERAEAGERAAAKKSSRGRVRRNVCDHIRRLVACGNRNRFVVERKGEAVVELPVTVMVIALLCAFWVCLPLLVIGLFAGCRYSFSGKELGRENINSALGKASEAAAHMKEAVAKA